MQNSGGFSNKDRRLPAGIFRLLLLAALIGLAVFGSRVWAEDGASEPVAVTKEALLDGPSDPIEITESKVIDIDRNDKGKGFVVDAGDGGKRIEIEIREGSIIAGGGVDIKSASTIVGSKLAVGGKTAVDGSGDPGKMISTFISVDGKGTNLHFREVEVVDGIDKLKLGENGGMFIGGAYGTGNETLNTESITFSDANGKSQTFLQGKGTVFLSDGGKMTLASQSTDFVHGSVSLEGTSARFAMDGGELNISHTNANFDNTAKFRMKDVDITGGVVNIGAGDGVVPNYDKRSWANAPSLIGGGAGGGSFAIAGDAEVNLGNYGILQTGAGYSGAMEITGGVINMAGGEGMHAVLRATADANEKFGGASLLIGENAVINVQEGKYGAILSRNTDFSGGNINVDGKLIIAGAADEKASTVVEGIQIAREKWGNFHYNGGTMTVGKNGIVDFISGDMKVYASGGEIKGTLYIDSSVGSTSGVYSTNLTVADDDTFTVGNLIVNVGEGVAVDGKLVVTDTVAAGSGGPHVRPLIYNPSQSDQPLVGGTSLNIHESGSLTANAGDFFSISPGSGNDVAGYTVTSSLADALLGSTGTVTLNAEHPKTAYNMTTEQYEALKQELGLADGTLNLLGVVVVDKLRLNASDGVVDTYISNAAATVTVDVSGSDKLVFDQNISVKDLTLLNGENVQNIALNESGTFTGSGNVNTSIVNGSGVGTPMDFDVNGILTLGLAGNTNLQGGMLGDITLKGGHTGQARSGVDVNDGMFKVGEIKADALMVPAFVNVMRSSSDQQKTQLTTDGIDLSNVDTGSSTSINVQDASLLVKGDIALNGSGDSGIRVTRNGLIDAKDISGAATISVENGSRIKADSIRLENKGNGVIPNQTTSLHVAGGSVITDKLDLGSSKGHAVVGDDTRGGYLDAGELVLHGGSLFLNRGWGDGAQSSANASTAVIERFDNDTSDGNIIVGQNSQLTYGLRDSGWLREHVEDVGVWGTEGSHKITAALGIYNPLTIGSGQSLVVDGELYGKESAANSDIWIPTNPDGSAFTVDADVAQFGKDSLLVVNGGVVDGNTAALTMESGTGTLNVEAGAKLYVYNAKAGSQFMIADGFKDIDSEVVGNTAWNSADNLNDSEMTHVDIVIRPDGSAVLASITAKEADDVYENGSDGSNGILDDIYGDKDGEGGKNDTDSENAGIRFVSRATSKVYNGDNLDKHIATIEGATQIAALAGAQMHTFNVMRLTSDAIHKRFSFSAGLIPHPYGPYGQTGFRESIESESALGCTRDFIPPERKRLMSVWAAPLYQHNRISGMEVGKFENEYTSNLYGANLGFDFDLGSNFRFGLVGGMGAGKSKTKDSLFAYTENSIDFFSVAAYAAWSTCNWSLLADGGYQRVKNDIRQDNWLGGGRNKAEPKVNGWNFGVTAEFLAPTDFVDVVPHVAVRYEGVGTKAHDVSSLDGVMFNVDSYTQHVFTIPVGVAVSKDFAPGKDVRVTPYADVGVLFAMGDRDYKPMVNIPTFKGHKFESRILDSAAFNGSVGVNAERGKVFGGVNYNVMASGNQTAHSVWANIGVNF